MQTRGKKHLSATLFFFLKAAVLMTVGGPLTARQPCCAQTVVWKLTDTALVGGLRPAVSGTPRTVRDDSGAVLFFNGVSDGLIVPLNPLQDRRKFTIEILFKPAADGPAAPRLVHGEDGEGNRFTIEARIVPGGRWYLDTFLKNGRTAKGLTLADTAALHSCGLWYWAALVYDGTAMTHYVNAVKEAEGLVGIGPMTKGQTAVATRLNRINPFKGWIGELRFSAGACPPDSLKRF